MKSVHKAESVFSLTFPTTCSSAFEISYITEGGGSSEEGIASSAFCCGN